MPKQLAYSAFVEKTLKQFPQLWGVKDSWDVCRGEDHIKIQRADQNRNFRFLLKKTARGQMWIFLLCADTYRITWWKKVCKVPESVDATWCDQINECAFRILPSAYSYVEAVVYHEIGEWKTFTIFRPPKGRRCLNAYIGEIEHDIPLADLCDPVYSL